MVPGDGIEPPPAGPQPAALPLSYRRECSRHRGSCAMIRPRTKRTTHMTIRLYGSWLSPFARKVALALELKALPYDYVDGLLAENRAELHKLNPRGEVPVL